jgi:hypothetical protein
MPSIDTQRKYTDVVGFMKPGDVIAFGGIGTLSDLVKATTRSTVSHVGIIQKAAAAGADALLIEATVHADPGKKDPEWRVAPRSCKAVVDVYERDVWWLPLQGHRRAQFDQTGFDKFMQSIDGRPFDVLGGGGVLLNQRIRKLFDLDIFDGGDDQTLLFCSELVAAALTAAKMVAAVNPTDISPADVCSWAIYDSPAVRLKGTANDIPGWNSAQPGHIAGSRESLFKAYAQHRLAKLDSKLPMVMDKIAKVKDLWTQITV